MTDCTSFLYLLMGMALLPPRQIMLISLQLDSKLLREAIIADISEKWAKPRCILQEEVAVPGAIDVSSFTIIYSST